MDAVTAISPAVDAAGSTVTLTAIVSAVGTFLAAIQLFQPKFAIALAMKREVGRIEPGFKVFYVWPQIIMVFGTGLLLTCILIAVLHQFDPTYTPTSSFFRALIGILELKNLMPLLLVAAAIAGVIQMNILSWLFLLIGLLFGAKRGAGWLQAWSVCASWDKGQPLLISEEETERIGWELLIRLSAPTFRTINLAPKPKNLSAAGLANITLFGCLIEEGHYVNHWQPATTWAEFYATLSEINSERKLFEPGSLAKFKSGEEFSAELREALAKKFGAKGYAVPGSNYYGVATYISRSWKILNNNGGSVLNMLPSWARLFGGRLYWLRRRLSQFPLLHDEGMREQCIKLLARWGVAPWVKKAEFLHPFSKMQSWLLLQEGVLTTLPDQKEVTFWGSGDVGISKIACRRIFEHVRQSALSGESAEAIKVSERFDSLWSLIAAADSALWGWAREEAEKLSRSEWKGARWKFENGRASRGK